MYHNQFKNVLVNFILAIIFFFPLVRYQIKQVITKNMHTTIYHKKQEY